MSSSYPVLDNKPIDQWKVTELKEELRRRKLKYSGKKDDLIKLLDQAIRVERENAEKEAEKDADNGANITSQLIVEVKNAEKVLVGSETAKDVSDVDAKRNEKVDDAVVQLDINSFAPGFGTVEHQEREVADDNNENVAALGQEKFEEGTMSDGTNPAKADDDLGFQATAVQSSPKVTEIVVTEVALSGHTTVTETVVTEVAVNGQALQNSGTQGGNFNSNIQLESEDSKPQLENEGLKPLHRDDMLDPTAPDNQVSEVSAILGSQVKSDSISTDSVSINEKIELKDNIIADNVKLELDANKLEIVEPSVNVAPLGSESHLMDVEEPVEEKAFLEKKDDNNATMADVGKKIDSADMGYSEKLNLDRSSGDDSLEDDVLENKQIDSKDNSDEVRGRTDKNEMPVVKEESLVDVGDDKRAHFENKSRLVMPAEKRKISDEEAVGNNEPSKRQRRWNSESLKLPEQQSSTPTPVPREASQPSMKHFSRSDSAVSEDTSKDRIVPPSPKSPTNSLRIDHFVRPFTLKAVQELLGKTGTFTCFWMDHIKTHCYVTYSSVEEAMETRSALYNIQWPPNNGGRPLVAEFVDPQEVKMRTDAPPPSPAAPVSMGLTSPVSVGLTAPAAPHTSQPQPSPRQPATRQQLPPPPTLPPPPSLSSPAPARERFTLPLPPPVPEKFDPPIVTLDDLFRKTKATPRIYYLPLSEEQVAAKLEAMSKNTKQ